jgi:hypothetical protein
LDGVSVRRIAVVYNVSRGIKKGDSNADNHADAVAQLVNEARPWPPNLGDRASKCLAIAKAAKSQGHTFTLQASAMTKFSWFAEPEEWTVYDRFVASAMKVRSQSTEARVLDFYATLQRRNFSKVAQQIQTELDEWPFMDLFGTRVLDKLMMLSGARELQRNWADNFVLTAGAFLEVLPPDWRQAVEEVADRVTKAVDANDFLRG